MTELRFDVADTGIGITTTNYARILDGAAGDGMALAIGKRLIELMGGALASTALPVSAATSGSWSRWKPGRRTLLTGGPDFSGLRVLLIESNGASRKALARQLSAWKRPSMPCRMEPRPWLPP